ncbi:alkaline phytoceramidase [Ramaria rubella]|nr:alkaline phytoceramidase [Ramaria rubella]
MSYPFHSPDSFNGGFWTSKAGSMDFCEENYLHSPYIAETTNTLSNLTYIISALYGIWNCRNEALPIRFILCNVSLLSVGLGSASYHGTLRHWAQAFDEIPMLYAVGFVTYTVFETAWALPVEQPSILLPAAMVALAGVWTTAYVYLQSAVFHEISFAVLLLFTTVCVLFLLQSPRLASNPILLSQIRLLFYQGAAVFVSGFLVWNLDNRFCIALRMWRIDIGWPATWLAQGHAFWHMATGMGAYRMIVASELLYFLVIPPNLKYTYSVEARGWARG